MTQNAPDPATLSDAEKTARIKAEIIAAGDEMRQRYPILQYQNAIGATIMAVSVAGMLGAAVAYAYDAIAWWLCVPLVAFFASLIHELEHDLIHYQYFRKQPKVNSFLLLLGWLARPSTINPLVRRKLHFHHHKHSGTESDLEERGITNGEPWGLRRLLMTGDNMLAIFLRPVSTYKMVRAYIRSQNPADDAEIHRMKLEQRRSYLPLGNLYYLAWHGWLGFHAYALTAGALGYTVAPTGFWGGVVETLNFLAVVWMLPSFLRTFCLHFISSNMHYYGDVEDGNIVQQCQVLNRWWLAPFQLFCFNFGSTHAIHHFVVGQPFYLRQMVAPRAHKVMREMGVRFNDLGTFRRANRWSAPGEPAPAMQAGSAA